MRRAALAAAIAAGALVVLLGWALAKARAEQAEGYARERAAQRRAVGASRHVELPATSSTVSSKTACVSGLDTFAVAIERHLVPLPDGRSRRVAALKAISDAAVRAERTAELARPAPTLPQRLGLDSGQPIAAERRACDGTGYAELQ